MKVKVLKDFKHRKTLPDGRFASNTLNIMCAKKGDVLHVIDVYKEEQTHITVFEKELLLNLKLIEVLEEKVEKVIPKKRKYTKKSDKD